MAFTGCKKTVVLPGNTPAVALNFFQSTDVMITAYNGKTTAVQIDNFNQHPILPFPIGTNAPIPAFIYTNGSATEFPGVDGGFMNFANFNYRDQGHRLYFTDTANAVQLDTTIHFAANSYNSVYFADAPVSAQNLPARYRAIAVTEARDGVPSDKVGVRFVHLGPDAGGLSVSVLKSDGSLSPLLTENLNYGQASAYQYLDNSSVASGLVKFSLAGTGNNAKILTGVPFTPGHSFIIVITGFLNPQQRQVRSGNNPDGTIKYASININQNLRAIVRKSY